MLGKSIDLEAVCAITDLELGRLWMMPVAELCSLFDEDVFAKTHRYDRI